MASPLHGSLKNTNSFRLFSTTASEMAGISSGATAVSHAVPAMDAAAKDARNPRREGLNLCMTHLQRRWGTLICRRSLHGDHGTRTGREDGSEWDRRVIS